MTCRARLPNLFIIGFAKCGTTSLFRYLAAHPDFCGSQVKEPHYFDQRNFDPTAYDLEEYSEFYRHCADQRFLFEASVSYVYGGRAFATYLQERFERPRIIVMLREPADRVYSFYRMCIDYGFLDPSLSFQNFLDTAEERQRRGAESADFPWRGYSTQYVDWLEPWLDVFEDDLFVGFFESLSAEPAAFCDEIGRWLGVDNIRAHLTRFEVENKTIKPRSARLHRLVRRLNERAQPLLDRRQGLKRRLRRFYDTVNTDRTTTPGLTALQRAQLDAHFAVGKTRLREVLGRRRPDLVLPAWLST